MENNHCRGREGGRERERERINQDQKRGQGINTSRVYSAQSGTTPLQLNARLFQK